MKNKLGKYALAALQESVRRRYRLYDRNSSGCFIEEHLRIADIECGPGGRDRRRVNLDIGVEIDDKRRERLRKGIDEGGVIERRSRCAREVVYNVGAVQPRSDRELALPT
jgi:hypothetical protein